jgi:aldose sugar dehydrogenase
MNLENKKYVVVILIALVVIILSMNFQTIFFRPTETNLDLGKEIGETEFEIVVENLEIPWEIVFLPSREMLVTERVGRLLIIGDKRKTVEIESVEHIAEGGLLGVALHPNFEETNLIYLYLTSNRDEIITNRVESYQLEGDVLKERKVIVDGIPGAPYHDGGRIVFGPDELLYITTGDATKSELAQNLESLAGKILRLRDDGSIPEGNPFGNEIYSYGHRNSQGLAWDEEGRLWATEHGRSGAKSGMDELNLIEKGKNYGWPVIEGDEEFVGMEKPIIHSGPDETWAPAGMAHYKGRLYFAGLRGESLYEYDIEENFMKSHFREEFGRLRAVVLGWDNYLYITTSNEDGRGKRREGGDKIIRIDPETFFS